ncbi:MAG: hypothetical protein HC896_08535 [Bacteroidales bacterium]|nr:hypothetical protein [Bacteroidales bacterium]
MAKNFLISLIVLFPGLVFSQIGGTQTYSFLHLTNSARVAALGGKIGSSDDVDLNFAYHNPALLHNSLNNHLVMNYVGYFAGVKYGYAAYANKIGRVGMFSAGLHYANYGKF